MTDLDTALWGWVQSLPEWQRDLLRRVSGGGALTEDQVLEATGLVVSAFGYKPKQPAPTPSPIPALPATPRAAATTRIGCVRDLTSVGMVELNQKLDFAATGLSLVYGETGSGKSSYGRVLKKACRAADRSITILPNVLAPNAPASAGTATIDIVKDGQTISILRNVNADPEEALGHVSVFDTACAISYAAVDNEITYTPPALRLFERLAALQGAIKKKIEEAITKLQYSHPLDIGVFDPATKAGALVRSLSPFVDPSTVRTLATVTDAESRRATELRASLAAAAAGDTSRAAAELRGRATSLRSLADQIDALRAGLSDDILKRLQQHDANLAQLQDASGKLAAALSAVARLPIGQDAWKTMWRAAHEYSAAAAPGQGFPPRVDLFPACPLCHQDVSGEAGLRFAKFEEFFQGEVERRRLGEVGARKGAFDVVTRAGVPSLLASQANLMLAGYPELLASVEADLAAFARRQMEMAAVPLRSVAPLPDDRSVALRELAVALDDKAKQHAALANPQGLAQATSELREIENRQRLGERLSQVLARIDALQSVQKLQEASSALTTTGLSRRIAELTEGAVTNQLRTRLATELQALRVDHVPVRVGARGLRGKTAVRLQLNANRQVDVREVLSEGEQRALALAFFLAEVAVLEHDGAIILDDPISSLDHLRRSYVAQRLVQEASKRQTIIFTHDIVFFLEVQELAKRAGVPVHVRVVRRTVDRSGVASPDLPWVAQNVAKRIKYLRNELQALAALERKGDQDTYGRAVKAWFELLREAWERAVEEKLFGGVVSRFNPGVQTLKLKDVEVTKEMTAEVEAGMTAASAWTHDQAPAINRPPPSLPELDKALKALEVFVSRFS